MTTQKVVNNPLGSYPVSVDRTAMGELRQAVGIDIGDVTADVWTPSRVSAANPLPTTATISGTIPLPTGASTAALQTTGNATLASIDVSTSDIDTIMNQVRRLDTSSGEKTLSWCGSDYGGSYYEPKVDANGFQSVSIEASVTVQTLELRQSTAAITVTAGSAASVQVSVLNSFAKKRIFYNDSTATAYLKYGTTASTSDFTVKLFPDATFEELHYYGRCDAIWTSATGNMRVTVIT